MRRAKKRRPWRRLQLNGRHQPSRFVDVGHCQLLYSSSQCICNFCASHISTYSVFSFLSYSPFKKIRPNQTPTHQDFWLLSCFCFVFFFRPLLMIQAVLFIFRSRSIVMLQHLPHIASNFVSAHTHTYVYIYIFIQTVEKAERDGQMEIKDQSPETSESLIKRNRIKLGWEGASKSSSFLSFFLSFFPPLLHFHLFFPSLILLFFFSRVLPQS